MPDKFELRPADLRRVCNPKIFKFKNTSELKPLDKIIGQQRAVRAIEFGLTMKSAGYNIFVTGAEGTGKSTIVRDIAARHARNLPAPSDWCLVNNFKDAFRPKAISVPAGKALPLSRKIDKIIEILKKEIPKAFQSEPYLNKSSEIRNKYAAFQRDILARVEKLANDRGLHLDTTQTESRIVPLREGEPVDVAELNELTSEELSKIDQNIRTTQAEVEKAAQEIEKRDQALYAEIERLVDETTAALLKSRLAGIRGEFKKISSIQNFIDALEADIVENVNIFLPSEDRADQTQEQTQPVASIFNRYKVNVLVNQEKARGAPVIYEPNPTYYNLFGRIEKRAYMGTVTTDFTMVQAGSLLNANGGFLILDVDAVLTNPFVWDGLKRALQTKLLVIEDIAEETGFGTVSLRPEPIGLEVKVILLGLYEPFEILQNEDPKFNKIFKVRADFDREVAYTEETVQQYARFIARVCKEENLLAFTAKGVAAIVEYGQKSVADKSKLSIRFGPLQAVLREAEYWARKNNARFVSDKYVIKAFNEYRFRYNLYEEKMHESYLDDTLMVDVDGQVVGQVNALAVYEIGAFSFGRPSRITAETYLGKKEVINIEREVELSGSTHDKGVLILSGYLGRTFAQQYPLSLSISLTFEQNYGGVDGDSASSTELYAIISSLSGIPIRQGIAVTGSVNQKGSIQAIGDANQKIEGFYEVCKSKGFTGAQGVIIPSANVKTLMLKKEVVDAVRQGDFHIYAVTTVEEGIEILTGIPAGRPDTAGNFPPGTVYAAVQQQLKRYMERSYRLKQEFGMMRRKKRKP